MRAILISIKPEWVAKILNGDKTIEIRKTMPKCDLPIDVYIYCTKDKNGWCMVGKNGNETYFLNYDKNACYFVNHNYIGNGKVVAKFTLNKVERIHIKYGVGWNTNTIKDVLTIEEKTCLSRFALFDYLGSKGGYAWHIDDLVIFDAPKELSEFWHYKGGYLDLPNRKTKMVSNITKAPQNFCYVEVSK